MPKLNRMPDKKTRKKLWGDIVEYAFEQMLKDCKATDTVRDINIVREVKGNK